MLRKQVYGAKVQAVRLEGYIWALRMPVQQTFQRGEDELKE